MRRSPVPVAVIALAVLLVGVLAYGLIAGKTGTNLDTAVKRGQRPVAPDAALALPILGDDTATASIASMKGHVVVLNIWASWCEPCKAEAPLLSAVNDALKKTGEGQVLGVTHQDTTNKSIAFAKDYGYTFPSVRDVDSKLYEAYGATGQPETYFIDQQGRVAAISRSVVTVDFTNRALAALGVKARVPANTPDPS
jgi:cytochrome c biogenesis protein CcmG/thiol:disulfide interchange protein DsbE